MKKKLSIIVTVYNKEPFLRRCLDSCINQRGVEPSSYEILVVNDGSTDNSLNIIQEYANSSTIIEVINQQNQGLSMARNNGVDASSGDYIWFVDSDDKIADNAVRLLQEAMLTGPDVIPIYAKTDGCSDIRNEIPASATDGRDILLSMKWEHTSVTYIYKRGYLLDNNFRFMAGIYHEDSELTPRLLYSVKSAVVIPHILYIVYRDPNSITQVPNIKRAYDCIVIAARLFDFVEKNVWEDREMRYVYTYVISRIFNKGASLACEFGKTEQDKYSRETYKNRRIFKAFRNSILKYRIEGVLLSLFPHKSVTIYKVLFLRHLF